MNMLIRACAIALALSPSLAAADTIPGKVIVAPMGTLPATAIYCDDGTGHAVICASSGGGGGGDASAANQTTGNTITATTRDEIGAITGTPVANTLQYRLEALRLLLASPALASGAATSALQSSTITALGSPYQAGGALPLPSGAATSALQTTGNTSLGTLAGTVATTGSTAPTLAQQVAGLGPSGNLRALSVGTLGGLLPGQGVPTSTRTTLTASTATPIEAAGVASRVAESFFVEATLTAPVYICSTQTTGCSATAYDFLIPSGATAGTIYSPIFATTARLYAYSTGTPVVVLNSWVAQ